MNRQRLLDYCQLMRIDKPIGTLLLLWPTLWALWLAADGLPPLDILAIFVAGTFLMRAAGCVVNDLADRDIDGAVERGMQAVKSGVGKPGLRRLHGRQRPGGRSRSGTNRHGTIEQERAQSQE